MPNNEELLTGRESLQTKPQTKLHVYKRRNHQGNLESHILVTIEGLEPVTRTQEGAILPNLSSNTNSNVSNDLDVPIALRKGTRSCTMHLFLNTCCTMICLSISFRAFTTNISSMEIPKFVQDALIVPK